MDIKRVQRHSDVKVNIDVPETFDYAIVGADLSPQGYYEINKNQRYTLPVGVFEGVLKAEGYYYVSHKKGDYDIELWKRNDIAQNIIIDSGTLPGGLQPLNMKDDRIPPGYITPDDVVMIYHSMLICNYNDRREGLTVTGTSEQIQLLIKIAQSVQRGTLLADMATLLGKSAPVVYGPTFGAEEGGASKVTPDTATTPTPPLEIKLRPVDDAGQLR